MKQVNWAEELRKRGIKTTPLPPPTPEQMEYIQRVDKAVCEFLKKLHAAHKASENSTLHFATIATHHSGHRSSTQKIYHKTRG